MWMIVSYFKFNDNNIELKILQVTNSLEQATNLAKNYAVNDMENGEVVIKDHPNLLFDLYLDCETFYTCSTGYKDPEVGYEKTIYMVVKLPEVEKD